jgi:hypothetical protein
MGISRQAYEEGIAVEKEHKDTYEWIKEYFKKRGKFPKPVEVYLRIAHDHLKESPDYYKNLKEMESKMKRD